MNTGSRPVTDLPDRFVSAGVLADTDLRLARRIGRIGGDTSGKVVLALAMALRAPRLGHVCVDLEHVAGAATTEPLQAHPGVVDPVDATDLPWPDPRSWASTLRASPLVHVAAADTNAPATPQDEPVAPLVMDGGRLYLDRYWRYERRLAGRLLERATSPAPALEVDVVAAELDTLFGTADGIDRQRLAAATAALRLLTVVAGGPGTGKTFTVTRILALLAAAHDRCAPGRTLRMALAAPTGKAAARLQESLRDGLTTLSLEPRVRDVLARVPAFTLHRLLGTRPDSRSRFRHDAGDPLPHDVVVVDEASMVSLPMMAKLAEAVREDARLVLLGDRDQLASVEAGAVFGDLCGPDGSDPALRLSAAAADRLVPFVGTNITEEVARTGEVARAESFGVRDAVVRLDRFHRFDEAGAIGELAAAIQREDTRPGGTLELLSAGAPDRGVQLLDPDADPDARISCARRAVDGFAAFAHLAVGDDPDAAAVLKALEDVRVLCAHRHGPGGAHFWNATLENELARRVDLFRPDGPWYVGRPVLVTENDYGVRLFNGDVGVVLSDPDHPGRRVVVFPAPDGTLRRIRPARIPACETTFATTIHRSQGSQYGHAVVVLPDTPSPILTRELVYTAVTRARSAVTLLAREAILADALSRPIQRASGLRQRLYPSAPSPEATP